MPQPIGNFRLAEPAVRVDPKELVADYPHLMAQIAQITVIWSTVECDEGLVFVNLIGGGSDTAVAIYRALSSNAQKDKAMNAVAQNKLSQNDYVLYLATRRCLRRVAKSRNNIVHGLVGCCDDISNALVILHQNDYFDHMNDLVRRQHLSSDKTSVLETAKQRFLRKSFVYEERDFKKVIERCGWAQDMALELAVLCSEAHPDKNGARLTLSNDMLIRRSIRRVRRELNID